MTDYATEAQAVEAIAIRATEPHPVEAGAIYATCASDGNVRIINTDDYGTSPRRKTAAIVITDPDHFIAYLAKHGTSATELWGSAWDGAIRAVIDAHGGRDEPAGWGGHVATLTLAKTKDWLDWVGTDRKWMPQSEFSEFVEDHLVSFETPSAAVMLELAQSFQAAKKVAFESGKRTSSGETTLSYRETIDAKAGRKGEVVIPERLTIVLQPFEGGRAYKVEARFRYRILEDALALSVAIGRADEILRAAFRDVVDVVEKGTARQVWSTN